jgi:hypothetical protein
VNRAVSLALWVGTLTGVGLCAAAAAAHAVGLAVAGHLARLGVVALLLTPPLRLAVTSGALWQGGDRRHALAAAAVLGALAVAAIRTGAL